MNSNWTKKSIKEFGVVISGGTPSSEQESYWNGDIVWITPADMSKLKTYTFKNSMRRISKLGLQNSSAILIPKNSIVISSRAPIGYIALAKTKFTTNQGCKSVVLEKNQDPLFHYYNFLFNKNEFIKNGEGTTFSEISKKEIEKLKFNYPPLHHQRKIAKILNTADAVIEKTEAAIGKYKAIKQGMMQDLFTRGIDLQTGQLRPAYKNAPKLYKKTELGWIPKEWECTELGRHSFITKLAGFEYTDHFDYSIGGEIVAVRALNLKKGKLDLTDIHTIPRKTSQLLKRSQLRKGDLVISYVGTVGAIAVINTDNKYHLAPNVAKITLDQNEINSFFLNEYLASQFGQKEIFRWISSTTQAALSMTNLRQLRIIKPKMLEQIKILNVLKSLAQKIETEEKHLAKHQSLKKGLMQDLLTGKVEIEV